MDDDVDIIPSRHTIPNRKRKQNKNTRQFATHERQKHISVHKHIGIIRAKHSRKNGNKMELDHFQQSQFSLTLITLSKVVIVSVCPQIVSTIRTNSQLFCFRHTTCVFCTHLSAARCVFCVGWSTCACVMIDTMSAERRMKSKKQKSDDRIYSNILNAKCVYACVCGASTMPEQINLQVVKNGRGQQIIIIYIIFNS